MICISINLTSAVLGETNLLLSQKGQHSGTIIVSFITIIIIEVKINNLIYYLPCYSKTFTKGVYASLNQQKVKVWIIKHFKQNLRHAELLTPVKCPSSYSKDQQMYFAKSQIVFLLGFQAIGSLIVYPCNCGTKAVPQFR